MYLGIWNLVEINDYMTKTKKENNGF